MNPLKHSWRTVHGALERRRLHIEWRRMVAATDRRSVATPARRILVIPCDPRTFAGSRGDEAMIVAAVTSIGESSDQLTVAAITSSGEGSATASRMGFVPLESWNADFALSEVLGAIERFGPDAAVVVGGDVMDGHYNSTTSARLLMTADLLARRGVPTNVLGFSFNERPERSLRSVFDRLGTDLRINIRDPRSLARFQRYSDMNAQLVADIAFLLVPDTADPAVATAAAWIRERHAVGDVVIGFNLHPMLVSDEPSRVRALVDSAARAIANASHHRSVSWLLIPHDFRGSSGDNACLTPLNNALTKEGLSSRTHHAAGEPSAAALKALVGLTDGVFSGRMHLAIAGLGMGVPAAAVTYQDKFEGLFQHFDLPPWLLLTPEQAVTPAILDETLIRFIDELTPLTTQVVDQLPKVRAAAERNLTGIV